MHTALSTTTDQFRSVTTVNGGRGETLTMRSPASDPTSDPGRTSLFTELASLEHGHALLQPRRLPRLQCL